MRMKLHTQDKKRCLYHIGHLARIPYILFALVVILGILSAPAEEIFTASSIIPALLLLVALFGIGYRDTWIFDGEGERIRQLSGVFLFVRGRTYPFERVSHLEISHFTRGYRSEKAGVNRGDRMRSRVMTVLALILSDGTRVVIDIQSERKERGSIEQSAASIGAVTGLGIEKDRAYDAIVPVTLSDLR